MRYFRLYSYMVKKILDYYTHAFIPIGSSHEVVQRNIIYNTMDRGGRGGRGGGLKYMSSV